MTQGMHWNRSKGNEDYQVCEISILYFSCLNKIFKILLHTNAENLQDSKIEYRLWKVYYYVKNGTHLQGNKKPTNVIQVIGHSGIAQGTGASFKF